jgi:hypothetical protein
MPSSLPSPPLVPPRTSSVSALHEPMPLPPPLVPPSLLPTRSSPSSTPSPNQSSSTGVTSPSLTRTSSNADKGSSSRRTSPTRCRLTRSEVVLAGSRRTLSDLHPPSAYHFLLLRLLRLPSHHRRRAAVALSVSAGSSPLDDRRTVAPLHLPPTPSRLRPKAPPPLPTSRPALLSFVGQPPTTRSPSLLLRHSVPMARPPPSPLLHRQRRTDPLHPSQRTTARREVSLSSLSSSAPLRRFDGHKTAPKTKMRGKKVKERRVNLTPSTLPASASPLPALHAPLPPPPSPPPPPFPPPHRHHRNALSPLHLRPSPSRPFSTT